MKDPCDQFTADMISEVVLELEPISPSDVVKTVAVRKKRNRVLRRERFNEAPTSVWLSQEAQEALDKMVFWWGVTKKEAINRALIMACDTEDTRTGSLFNQDSLLRLDARNRRHRS